MLAMIPVAVASAEPPAASLLWFPTSPLVGEPVSLASTSIDMSSPITSLAWDVAGNGAYQEDSSPITTTFSSPGPHVVHLRVTAADGSASVATATIQVSSDAPVVMVPFPIVRLVGSDNSSGARLRLLSVEAPVGSQISVSCRQRGCPVSYESQFATTTAIGTVTVSFRRFERALHAGLILEVRVHKSGEIGKYTRVVIRRRRPPARVDECLDAAGVTPIACPF
jgi:hypothetical protein